MNQPLSLCELHFTHLDNGVSTKSVLCACVCVCVCSTSNKTFVLPEDV